MYVQVGRLGEATTALTKALASHQALLGGGHHPRCIEPLIALGRCCARQLLHGDAVSWFTQVRLRKLRNGLIIRSPARGMDAACVTPG